MQPLVPTIMIKDLAREHFAERPQARHQGQSHIHNPDGFVTDESVLAPDPVFMLLRALGHWGPIGALRRWIDRAIEEREARRYPIDVPQDFTVVEIDRSDDDIAA